jgi:transglutaminase-like putative cysteine protease
MIKIIFIFLAAGIMQQAAAQTPYKATHIPPELKPRANAVLRNMETTVDMRSPENVVISVKKVITVLNKNGDSGGGLHVFYNKNSVIKGIKGEIYDEEGLLINKFNEKNFKDESAISDFSLFEDDRIKYFQPQMIGYPYTVVYEYEIKNKQNLLIPDWYVSRDAQVAVESTSYHFISKPEDKLNIKAYHFKEEGKQKKDDKSVVYSWEVKNLPALRTEPYAPPADQYLAHVKIAPERFSYYNSTGQYSNWHELGKWIYDDLIQNRQTLAPTTVQHIKELVAGMTDPKEKAKKIYEYVQRKTRYVSIQVGIGGFQPSPAAEVEQLGYGDCKGLVNYMQSLLKAVDIPSYYCIVYAGNQKRSLDESFASMDQANHVILCLPFENDTTWLECTSQTAPFGFLGDFTDDRLILACTKEGGKILRTPKLKTSENLIKRTAELQLDHTGSITGSMKTLFKGSNYDDREYIAKQSLDNQMKSLKRMYDIDNINFSSLQYSQDKGPDPSTLEDCKLSMKNYASTTQNRAFMVLNPFNKKASIPEVNNRTHPLYLNRGYTEQDEINYHLPEKYTLEFKATEVLIKNEFGHYELRIVLNDKTLTYKRTLIVNDGLFAAAKYTEFFEFINQVNNHDQSRVIFKLQDGL